MSMNATKSSIIQAKKSIERARNAISAVRGQMSKNRELIANSMTAKQERKSTLPAFLQ